MRDKFLTQQLLAWGLSSFDCNKKGHWLQLSIGRLIRWQQMPTGFFQQNFQKHIWDRKSEHHHRIWHIRNSLGIKFHLKLTIFNFWAKLMQNRYFQSKREKKWKSQSNLTYSNFSRFQISALANNFDFLIFFQMKTEKKKWTSSLNSSYSN